ncbi:MULTISPECIES: abortive infection family protein [unclassified Frigoribacterium]|uniref:abortive infection family protein n=1 Tax=unclassified Frigoribacterium TaxID=2627005 RepID=UPI000A5386AD|nr:MULTISPECIES: abortive infection family protein [unclassified Frigoribacterium]
MATSRHRISLVTRQKVADSIALSGVPWAGRLDEPDFLARIYDLMQMPSTDSRYLNARDDIYQHQVRNYDYGSGWIFTDSRFNLLHADDDEFLGLLTEMLHPVVRPDEAEVAELLANFNEMLRVDGFALYAKDWISGHAVYGWQRIDAFHGSSPDLRLEARPLTDPVVLHEHLTRIRNGLTTDPAATISSCKSLLESLFKIVLDQSSVEYPRADDVPQLYRKVADLLALSAEAVPGSARGSEASQKILRTLVTTVGTLAELRNELGIDHGQSERSAALARHARLALNATVTVAEFILDTWQDRIDSGRLKRPV